MEGESDLCNEVYKKYDVIQQAPDKSSEEGSYLFLIESVKKNDPKAKQLIAQILPQFFHYFPSLSEQAINAQFDLCEDEKLNVSSSA